MIGELAQGTPQLVGEPTFILLIQNPLLADTVMFVPIGIFVIIFAPTVPPVVPMIPVSVL